MPESHNGVVQHSVAVTTLVQDRRLLETRHHYQFFATFDGAEYLVWGTAAEEVPEPVGDVTVKTVQVENGYLHQFWLPAPMQRGRTYDLRFVMKGDPGDPLWLMGEGLAFHEPVRIARFEARFQGECPPVVWSYSGLTALEQPGIPRATNQLGLDPKRTVQAEFYDLYGGLYSGLAWDW
ncbi:hypothetical protein [Luteipulveratus mongoliensis]|uniref:Uncharacterized protein n=1 Tax=Luteipulveratus mongoliensis TaxID=571913 RepID=A0A0K1JNB6_9MICO|nr:hypothetical protein [Luteipulveratus mongoliensis]AKU18197.1 hypothetical protein VV02_24015 [Luteipulveratus mongoliensis]